MQFRSDEHSKKAMRQLIHFVVGATLALVALEATMHELSGTRQGPNGFEQRWYTEGIAHSHFTPDYVRMTGNGVLSNGRVVLIVGDSHVEANQICDGQTMGSVLERGLRTYGEPWNVVQYGWSGADGADLIFEAPMVLAKFNPSYVIAVLTKSDFAHIDTGKSKLIADADVVRAVASDSGSTPGRPASFSRPLPALLTHSGLLYATLVRVTLDIRPRLMTSQAKGPSGTEYIDDNVALTLAGLRFAYGTKLRVLYAPAQLFAPEQPPEPEETKTISVCGQQRMHCVSLRARMLEALRSGKLSRGFSNTAPGEGHLNAVGHALAAAAIQDWIRAAL